MEVLLDRLCGGARVSFLSSEVSRQLNDQLPQCLQGRLVLVLVLVLTLVGVKVHAEDLLLRVRGVQESLAEGRSSRARY